MVDIEKLIGELLLSVAGILVFLGVNHIINFNGYIIYSPFLIIAGALLLFFIEYLSKILKGILFINEATLKSLAYVLIFVGVNVYIDRFINQYWPIFIIVGLFIINRGRRIQHLD